MLSELPNRPQMPCHAPKMLRSLLIFANLPPALFLRRAGGVPISSAKRGH